MKTNTYIKAISLAVVIAFTITTTCYGYSWNSLRPQAAADKVPNDDTKSSPASAVEKALAEADGFSKIDDETLLLLSSFTILCSLMLSTSYNIENRLEAASLLAQIAPEESKPTLLEGLRNPDCLVRLKAAQICLENALFATEVQVIVQDVLGDKSLHGSRRNIAAKLALGFGFSVEEAKKQLFTALKDENSLISREAAETCVDFGLFHKEVRALLQTFYKDSFEFRRMDALGIAHVILKKNLNNAKALRLLRNCLKDQDGYVRMKAVRMCFEFDLYPAESMACLKTTLTSDTNVYIRLDAAKMCLDSGLFVDEAKDVAQSIRREIYLKTGYLLITDDMREKAERTYKAWFDTRPKTLSQIIVQELDYFVLTDVVEKLGRILMNTPENNIVWKSLCFALSNREKSIRKQAISALSNIISTKPNLEAMKARFKEYTESFLPFLDQTINPYAQEKKVNSREFLRYHCPGLFLLYTFLKDDAYEVIKLILEEGAFFHLSHFLRFVTQVTSVTGLSLLIDIFTAKKDFSDSPEAAIKEANANGLFLFEGRCRIIPLSPALNLRIKYPKVNIKDEIANLKNEASMIERFAQGVASLVDIQDLSLLTLPEEVIPLNVNPNSLKDAVVYKTRLNRNYATAPISWLPKRERERQLSLLARGSILQIKSVHSAGFVIKCITEILHDGEEFHVDHWGEVGGIIELHRTMLYPNARWASYKPINDYEHFTDDPSSRGFIFYRVQNIFEWLLLIGLIGKVNQLRDGKVLKIWRENVKLYDKDLLSFIEPYLGKLLKGIKLGLATDKIGDVRAPSANPYIKNIIPAMKNYFIAKPPTVLKQEAPAEPVSGITGGQIQKELNRDILIKAAA